jgi:hypothetical protein
MLLFRPRKAELFVAGALISSAVMDSPLWGVSRLLHGLPLWHIEGDNLFVPTQSFAQWIVYYYDPIEFYQVWRDYWLASGLPNAAMIFWSVVLRFPWRVFAYLVARQTGIYGSRVIVKRNVFRGWL